MPKVFKVEKQVTGWHGQASLVRAITLKSALPATESETCPCHSIICVQNHGQASLVRAT